ncbi:MAG TPA: universal stress protein [Longimicrobiales bacterium]|nr:universal stress protein [Longimicrobiales bacterium]
MTHPAGDDFLQLLQGRKRGRLKIYIGSAAGVGKTVRMLQEAQALRNRNVDIVLAFIETHGRADTGALVEDLEVIPRKKIEYRGVVLEEMDLEAVLARQPEIAVVDELAHTNVPGSRNRKRYEDVLDLLHAGINVITAVNVQHIESLNDIITRNLGVTVTERVPDSFFEQADQVVNIDVSAEDLRQRLAEGRIYAKEKIDAALQNFFTTHNLTTLRELALREVASSVDRRRAALELQKREQQPKSGQRLMVAMSSNPPRNAILLRKASRIAGRLNTDWLCVYVQTPDERADRIDATVQRRLVDNIQLAESLGAEVVKLEATDVVDAILRLAREQRVSMIIIGQTLRGWWYRLTHGSIINRLLTGARDLDVLIVSFNETNDR